MGFVKKFWEFGKSAAIAGITAQNIGAGVWIRTDRNMKIL